MILTFLRQPSTSGGRKEMRLFLSLFMGLLIMGFLSCKKGPSEGGPGDTDPVEEPETTCNPNDIELIVDLSTRTVRCPDGSTDCLYGFKNRHQLLSHYDPNDLNGAPLEQDDDPLYTGIWAENTSGSVSCQEPPPPGDGEFGMNHEVPSVLYAGLADVPPPSSTSYTTGGDTLLILYTCEDREDGLSERWFLSISSFEGNYESLYNSYRTGEYSDKWPTSDVPPTELSGGSSFYTPVIDVCAPGFTIESELEHFVTIIKAGDNHVMRFAYMREDRWRNNISLVCASGP